MSLWDQFYMIKGFLFLLVFAHLFQSSNIYAREKINLCHGSNVVVTYSKTADYQLVCDSVNDVIEIAKKIGLSEELNISISIVDRLIINNTVQLLAFFNPNTMEIQVLSMDACKKTFGNEVVFGQEIDKELHRSIIIHEIAHALFWNNMGNKVIVRELHEYFAYIIQLALLDKSHRDKIIYSSNVPAYSNRSEISEEYYLLNPTYFAVKSYLHFTNIKESWPYLQSLFKE